MADPTTLQSLSSELPANIVLTLLVVPLLQWAKRNKMLKFVNEQSVFYLSGLIAFFGAVGIHFSYDPTAGSATITGLTFASVFSGAAEWFKQFAAQHWGHRVYSLLEVVGRPDPARRPVTLTDAE